MDSLMLGYTALACVAEQIAKDFIQIPRTPKIMLWRSPYLRDATNNAPKLT
ncbi:hypothetical protein [Dolichospermum sp. UHCC 0259]|uniref:hypothetical protein n=1 Tax=Dolichospermum sp. UHCC 0259 TaxID=2590010 RepID=UPI001C2D984C|nr:hypothetical protein [Dolichospermum sp. UHCC 0259]